MAQIRSRIALAILSLIVVAPVARAQSTVRVSVASDGVQPNAASLVHAMTPDGRYIAFGSSAPNLWAGIFRHDRLGGSTVFVGPGSFPSISDDGQVIAFESTVDNLVSNDTNGRVDVFIWTAVDGSVQRASVVQGNQQGGGNARISANGRYVVFAAQTLSNTRHTVAFDRVLQVHSIAGGTTGTSDISADGRYAAYTSVQAEDTLDANGFRDVFLLDRQTGTRRIVSTSAAGVQGNGDSDLEGMSDDGRLVLFVSWSPNFPGTRAVSPITRDLFVKDMQTGALTQVNVNGSGQRFDVATSFNGFANAPTISATGRYVVFSSPAANVVAGDTNGLSDTFLYDRDTATTVRVSIPESGGEAAGGGSYNGVASSDGRYVALTSDAHNLVPGDTNFLPDIFLRDAFGAPPCAVTIAPAGLAVVSSAGGNGTINVTAPSSCTWTARVNAPWIRTTGSIISGVGDGAFSYVFDPYAGTTIRSGAIVVNTTAYGLRQLGTAVTQPPFGPWETPVPGAGGVTNVSGAIQFTGWALDDLQVTRIRVYRDPAAGEGTGQVFIGDAVQVAGARPDVAQAFSPYPYSTSAGWGLMVLTNMLPNQGNGVFTFHVYYDDADGHTRLAGTRTLTATNATASVPFGTIDTPGQGQTVSGTIVNFGWALTPQPGSIPSGLTIDVFIDGVNVGRPSYGHFRSDIATLFPGYANTNAAIGHFTFNSSAYADGVHTIAWVVTDNLGRASGIGSRYFTIQNGATPVTPPFARRAAPQATARSAQPILSVRGDEQRWVRPDAPGVYEVPVRDLDRLELRLDPWHGPASCGMFTVAALPAGSSLDARSGVFAWQPAAGVGGAHDIAVTWTSCGGSSEAIAVRVVFEKR